MKTEQPQLEKARKELAIASLTDWPKNEHGAFICSKTRPMPKYVAKGFGRWEHDDVKEDFSYNSDHSIKWDCKSCGHTWKTEMPD